MEAIAVDTTTAAVGSDEQPAYRIFSFMIEAKTASDHEEFHEKARATIHQAQVLLEEEKKRTKGIVAGNKSSEDISVHSVFVKSYTLKATESRSYIIHIYVRAPNSLSLIISNRCTTSHHLQRVHSGSQWHHLGRKYRVFALDPIE